MPPTPPNPTAPPETSDQRPDAKPRSEPLSAEDFYMEGPYLVFTAAYHLKRGYCCNSDCRHCPYRDVTASSPAL